MQRRNDETETALRTQLGDEAFERQTAEGRNLTLEEAAAVALDALHEHAAANARSRSENP
jgi:hypothetical protein